jgi:uncharacterized protein YjcR
VAQKPLTPKQQKAADLIGQGWKRKLVAAEVGVSPKTLRRWSHREDFRALVTRRTESVLSSAPTARVTLEEALNATKADGTPDYKIRVSAARALIGADGRAPDPGPARETLIHSDALDPEGEGE